jgi:hypothetical protein
LLSLSIGHVRGDEVFYLSVCAASRNRE